MGSKVNLELSPGFEAFLTDLTLMFTIISVLMEHMVGQVVAVLKIL